MPGCRIVGTFHNGEPTMESQVRFGFHVSLARFPERYRVNAQTPVRLVRGD